MPKSTPSKSATATQQLVAAHPSVSIGDLVGLPPEASAEELLELGVQAYNASGAWMVRAGACFKQLRDVSKRVETDFLPQLEARGIGKSYAYNAMQLADYIGSLPEADARRMLKVPHTKVLAIANADPDVVAGLLEDGSIDGDAPLSVRELRLRLAEAERTAANATAEAERLTLQAESAASYQAELDKKSGFPAWLRNLRVGVVAECSGIDERLDVIAGLLCELEPQKGDNKDDAALRLAGATTAVHVLNALYARLNTLLDNFVGGLPEEALTGINPLSRISDAELSRVREARERIVDEAGYQRRLREHQQQSEKPRGRGRPPKAAAAPVKPSKKKG